MKTKNKLSKSGKLAGASILTAIAASLCCITPVLALISGATGVASSFSWLEPLRPYLIGVTLLVLGFAWYQKLKPRDADEIACDCDVDEKKPFMQTKTFLGIVTVFAALMLTFPYYSSIFYPDNKKEIVVVNAYDVQTLQLDVEGMTCEACDSHVAHAAQEVEGVIEARADHITGKAEVEFDKSKTSKEAIIQSINATSYKVVGEKLK
jgi:copper chaperone CopZ